jgi:hypothetical protein
MANIQTQFEQFDKNIRLGRFKENQTLREKRDTIIKVLKARLPDVFTEYGETCPGFYFLDQGSYEMDTGVKPLNGDFDIDQGLYFEVGITAYPDPVVLKERVHEALDGHTDSVCIRRSCVTVFYHNNDEPIYHVDIAIYSDGAYNSDGKSYTAKGKLYSAPENRIWRVSDPQALTEIIFVRFEGENRKQFRRIIRAWKRWKTVNFPTNGNAAPNGIGLTVATYDHLQTQYIDQIANKHDDLRAMRLLIDATLSRFALVWDENSQQFIRRLAVTLPIEPGHDLFAHMTAAQMTTFEQKLIELKDALNYAAGVSDPTAACERLRQVFGEDFPVPEKKETATVHAPGIVSSGNSA